MFKLIKDGIQKSYEQATKVSIWLHGLMAIVAFGLLGASNTILDASYAASKFPVPYAEGQTAFSGEKLKGYYGFMLEQQTLPIYWRTQFIDFAFIASMFITGLVISLLLARLFNRGSFLHKIALFTAFLVPFGAICDIIENLISFIMLSQPLTFANWITPIYSSFAVVKFACIAGGYILWTLLVISFIGIQIYKRLPRKMAMV